MAGRPATVRGSGLTGLHYGLFTFVIVSVAALGGFIFQLTKVSAATERAASTERQLSRIGRPTPPVGTYYENEASARNTTVVGVMTSDIQKLSRLVAGTEDDVAASLEQQANTLLTQIAGNKPGVLNAGDTLLTAIRKLDESLTQGQRDLESTQSELGNKSSEVVSLGEQLQSVRTTFESQVQDLSTQLEQERTRYAEQMGNKDAQVTDLTRTVEELNQQLLQLQRNGASEVRELKLDLQRRDNQIARLQQEIQGLKGTFDPEAILRKADGRIVRAIPGSDVVYINLGSSENIKVGMTFEVFSQISASPYTLRGKASLEVATLMDDTAECRVTRRERGQPIVEGDIVVNIAYEQSRRPKFVVRGDFDLNYDGTPDFDGIDHISSIIRQWGGQVVSDLDESVDYVVIGVAPTVTEVSPNASDIVRDQAERRALERSQFQKLIEQARSMYIPVITQNQFLFLTGYAGDVTIRERR